MLKKIAIGIISLVVLAAVVGMLLPRVAHIERSIEIGRPASLIFATLATFHGSSRWSPWVDYDPNMKIVTEGPREGVGAKMSWSGNERVGTGSQQIRVAVDGETVETDIRFGSKNSGKSTFIMARSNAGTKLTWTLDFDMGADPVGRLLGLTMDRWFGPDCEKGLERIKAVVEGLPNVDIAGMKVERVVLEPQTIAYVSRTTALDSPAIEKAYSESFAQVADFIMQNRLQVAGAPLGIDVALTAASYGFEAGMPVDRGDVAPAGGVQLKQTYGGAALKTTHVGPYDGLHKAAERLAAYAAAHGYESNGALMSWYLDESATTPADELRTELYWPVK